jgi:hypothetical protein
VKLFAAFMKWLGLLAIVFGISGTIWAIVVFFQIQTGSAREFVERCCSTYGRIALSTVLSSMFFVMTGAGLVLLSRPLQGRLKGETKPPRWPRWLALALLIYALSAFAMATILAGMSKDFGDATAGIVTYCMLLGVGLLIAAWGLKRASDAPSA